MNLLKILLAVALAFFLLGIVFSILFKVGLFVLLVMGIVYIFDRVFGNNY